MFKFWQMLTPTQVVKSINDIRPETLKSQGITAIITDLDNTLVPWRRYDITEAVVQWLEELELAQIKICIASNTLHTSRLRKLSEQLKIPFVDRVRKPNVDGFIRAMELMKSDLPQTAVVGDQIFTDVLCGNKLGLCTILLRPPLAKEEFLSTRILRNVERWIITRLQRQGAWPEYLPSANAPVQTSDPG